MSSVETEVKALMQTIERNADSISKLDRMVSKLTLLTPAISAALFVIGLLVGNNMHL